MTSDKQMKMKIFKHKIKWAIVLLLAVSIVVPVAYTNSDSYFEISKNLDIFATLYRELNTYYVDEIKPSDLMRNGIDGMLANLDPYTNYISEAEIEGYRMQTTGKYGGIGATIRTLNGDVIVAEPYEGYAADKAGLIAGDILLEIGGEVATGMNMEEISKLLKGQAGTQVTVKVKRLQADGSYREFELNINREEIKIHNVPYYGMITDDIGYINLSNFTENAGKEVHDALAALEKENPNLAGVVLDLRGNPGGLLNEAVNIANVFVKKDQEIVSTKGKVPEWDKTFKSLNPPVDTDIPLAILTNRRSASASEIVSGSMQDLDRGVIIGQKTFGKGLVQTTRSLAYNTKLKVTTAKYYIPSGRCIQAINYAERNPDGSVARIPDSLKTPFKTANGRVVYDGGGIDPDIPVEPKKGSKIAYSLMSKYLIFNYATIYHAKHDKIAGPKEFVFTDADWQDFLAYLADKDYDYSTKSEDLIDELEETAKNENYYDAVEGELNTLRQSVQHDKKNDLEKHKQEITQLLEEEIVSRYYYNSGRIKCSFGHDPDVSEAIRLFGNLDEYHHILTGN